MKIKYSLFGIIAMTSSLCATAQSAPAPSAPAKAAEPITHEWAPITAIDLAATPDPIARKTGEGTFNLARFPDVFLHDLEGKERHLQDYFAPQGMTLVVFFAPWCNNSIAAADPLMQLYKRWSARGLHVVAVGEFAPTAEIAAFAKHHSWDFPVLAGAPEKDEGEARTHATLYRLRTAMGDPRKWGTPSFYFLNAGDRVHIHAVHGEMIAEDVEAFLTERLGKP